MELPFKEVLIFQGIVEVLLVVLLVFVLWRLGKKPPESPAAAAPEELKKALERFLEESEKISESFSRNLEDKKNLSRDLILKMDKRLEAYATLLAATEASLAKAMKDFGDLEDRTEPGNEIGAKASREPGLPDKANPAAPEVRALVAKLAREGKSVEDIAVRSRLDRGEVELILELEGGFDL
ncbi:MAG: hypothetical protein LBF41_03655 [Deltaproteobacteria bacterium]|nr:hypothetical protein [Deltaproteobacteria bacterium]